MTNDADATVLDRETLKADVVAKIAPKANRILGSILSPSRARCRLGSRSATTSAQAPAISTHARNCPARDSSNESYIHS